LSICDKKGEFVGGDEFVISAKDFVPEIAKGGVCLFNYWLNVRKEKWIQSPFTVWTTRSFYV
jgi:hypothetical protein